MATKSESKSEKQSQDRQQKSEQKAAESLSPTTGDSNPVGMNFPPAQSLSPTTGGSTSYLDEIANIPQQPTGPTQAEIDAQKAAEAERIKAENAARVEAAYQQAIKYGTQQVADRGLNSGLIDQYGVLDAYKAMLDQARGGIDPTGADPYSGFQAANNFNNALDAGQTRYRTALRDQVVGAGGDGFEYNVFGDTSDDAILQAIYDSQKSDAQLVLDRAKARGQLNDVGYTRATTDLGAQGKGGMASLQQIGGGILADYRKQLSDTYNQGLERAGQATFNQPYDAGSIVNRLGQMKTNLGNSLEGDIYKAVGGSQYFTPSTSIGKGGSVQGTINPSKINFKENPLLEAFRSDAGRRTYGNNTGSTASTGNF